MSINDLLLDVLVNNDIVKSKREGREFISNGAVSVNGEKISDIEHIISLDNVINDKYMLIKKGKKKYYLFDIRR
ncbi:MAG: S4 domain-containing protein [Bacilli bacterium]